MLRTPTPALALQAAPGQRPGPSPGGEQSTGLFASGLGSSPPQSEALPGTACREAQGGLRSASLDKLIVKDWYLGTQYRVEQFAFADGSVLTDTQVQGLVGAMAVFSASAAGGIAGTASNEPVMTIDRFGSLASSSM